MAMVFFSLAETSKLWFSSPWLKPQSCGFLLFWPKPQSCGLIFHGFFQSSQSHFLLHGHMLKVMVFFFLDFSKAPKVVVLFLVFPKALWLWSSCVVFGY
jgi:hypothetical protein